MLIAVISLMLGKGGEIGRLGLAGMGGAGLYRFAPTHFQKVRPRDYLTVVTLMALIAAIGTTGYTLIDDQALRQLRDASAIEYIKR